MFYIRCAIQGRLKSAIALADVNRHAEQLENGDFFQAQADM
jgi:hypothetical protein